MDLAQATKTQTVVQTLVSEFGLGMALLLSVFAWQEVQLSGFSDLLGLGGLFDRREPGFGCAARRESAYRTRVPGWWGRGRDRGRQILETALAVRGQEGLFDARDEVVGLLAQLPVRDRGLRQVLDVYGHESVACHGAEVIRTRVDIADVSGR